MTMKQPITIIIILLLPTLILSQEPVYFNNVYQHGNNFAIGMTILETDDGYVGYGGTEDPGNIGQMLLLYKISLNGEELIWKSFGEDYHSYYYGNVGGAMIKTNDGNFALACHYSSGNPTYASLIKLNTILDTVWEKNYNPEYQTVTVNCSQTSDSGYILTGWVWLSEEAWSDVLLMKVDSLGNYQWHQLFDDNLAEKGSNVIQTPDGGFLIGGYTFDPTTYHSLDAMVIKTDSLGNEEWTEYYGNPWVDDDMAHVMLADDGNYLVLTVYGEWEVSPTSRTGRIFMIKLDNNGNTIWQEKIGPKDRNVYLKNLRLAQDEDLIVAGWVYNDTVSEFIYEGLLYKFDQQGDSIWMRNYYYYHNQYDINRFYDVCPTTDNGYIAIGKARPDQGGNSEELWIIKVDSMGCDTPGCATGVQVFEVPESKKTELIVWPNPTNGEFEVWCSKFEVKGERTIKVYNSQGIKVEEIKVPENSESMQIDVSHFPNGLYYLQYIHTNHVLQTTKFIKN